MSSSLPSISSSHYNAYLSIASMLGFQKPGGRSSWKSLSGREARSKHNQLIAIFAKLSHGETCGCSSIVMTVFASGHLPQFMDLYLQFATDPNTLIPFALLFFNLVPAPYLGSFIRQYDDPQLLIRHQIRVLLSNGLHRLQSTAFTSISQVTNWAFEISNIYKLALYLRTLLYHISKALDVPNPIVPSEDTSSLIEAIEELLPSLTYRLEVPFDRATIIGTRPNRVAYKQFTEEAEGVRGKLQDALHHLHPTLAFLRAEEDADARTPFKLLHSSMVLFPFPEDTCAFFVRKLEKMETTDCEASELKACSKCRSVVYCSKDHQKRDWKGHKDTCFSPIWITSDEEEASGSS